ncbi:uncharacterized protein L969DRAFT_85254 [Mixia osmundae IAM 14324]|nr:uncharacterized protein L969DRAFT_85254 [Mixia osmundae IAM 14324]KEI41473.1 hypothetical protein L969DRAFT_85254 [Mixia osmundae IAM 14324]
MQGFMLYMSGGGVQIFSMMMVWMLIKNAVVAAVGVSKAFAPFTGASVPPAGQSPTTRESFAAQQTVYVICQGLLLALGLYKCHSMGLLPTASSDWLAFMEPPAPLHDSLARPVVYADGFRPVV